MNDDVFHKAAAISEGICPICHDRLSPHETPRGLGGTCVEHGSWYSDFETKPPYRGSVTWWPPT